MVNMKLLNSKKRNENHTIFKIYVLCFIFSLNLVVAQQTVIFRFNADYNNENELLKILNPLLNSESVWKSHALYLMAEYFYSKNEMQKSKEFFNQIINLENANQEIKLESQRRLNRDLSE